MNSAGSFKLCDVICHILSCISSNLKGTGAGFWFLVPGSWFVISSHCDGLYLGGCSVLLLREVEWEWEWIC